MTDTYIICSDLSTSEIQSGSSLTVVQTYNATSLDGTLQYANSATVTLPIHTNAHVWKQALVEAIVTNELFHTDNDANVLAIMFQDFDIWEP